MSFSHHPCINTHKCKFINGLFHHHVQERINTKKRLTKKHVKLQYQKDWMLIEIKGYVKFVAHQLQEHMEYNGMNKDVVNPHRKH